MLKNIAVFSSMMGLFWVLANSAIAAPVAGSIGCFQEIQNRLQNREAFGPCKVFLERYQNRFEAFAEDPKKVKETIRKELTQNESLFKSGKALNYEAVLWAVLTKNTEALPQLQKLAEIEKNKKVLYAYATRAVERLTVGKCSNPVLNNLSEICNAEDPALLRVGELAEEEEDE